MTRGAALASLILMAALGGLSCGRDATPVQPTMPPTGDGAVIASETLTDVDPSVRDAAASMKRMTYTSHSGINNSPTYVSGSVFVPRGQPREGGFRIVVLGHQATGTSPDCAPSLSPTLLNASATVKALLEAGYVVAMPDYQGLGSFENGPPNNQTYYPYLDSTTAGYNMIDAVRAARALVPLASRTWAALGTSEGGQAAWAANELADNYGSGLTLVGSASISPFADIGGLADAAAAGTVTKEQQWAYQAFLAALKETYGDDLKLDDYLRGIVREKWDVLKACQGPGWSERVKVTEQITPDDLRPAGPGAVAALHSYLKKTNLPQGPAQAPMLVVYGGQDSLIPPAWTEQALAQACEMDDVIQIQLQPDKGHGQIDLSAALGWISDRFNSIPAPNDCPS